MANHGWVLVDNLSREAVKDSVQRFIDERLLGHASLRETEGRYEIYFPAAPGQLQDELVLNFWISTCYLADDKPGIEFRHGYYGPASKILWWMDLELEKHLARDFNGTLIDEADCTPREPKAPREFKEALSSGHGLAAALIFWVERAVLPVDIFPELKEILDPDGEIFP